MKDRKAAGIELLKRHLPASAVLVLSAFLTSSCVLSPTKPEEVVAYSLEISPAASKGSTVAWQLEVEHPASAEPLSDTRVAVREADRGYGVLAGARWSERAPDLVQSALVQCFEDSGRIRGVGRTSSGVRGDYLLLSELRSFQVEYPGPSGAAPAATVVLSVKLLRASEREVVAAKVFSERRVAGGRDVAAIVSAFGDATGKLLPQIRDWTLEEGERDFRQKKD